MFKLQRNGKGKYRYEYRCCDIPGVTCEKSNSETPLNSDGNGNMVYLDRHSLACSKNNFISQFKLNRNGAKLQYKYQCCGVSNVQKACYKANTNFNADGSGNTVYLDRHRVSCKNNYGITEFKLKRNGGKNKIRYEYECCTVKERVPGKG